MSISGSRAAAEINLDELERRLRAAGAQHASAEDPLSELARLVESSRRAAASSSPPGRTVSAPVQPAAEPSQPLEMAPLRPSIDEAPDHPTQAAAEGEAPPIVEEEAPQESEVEHVQAPESVRAEQATQRRSGGWTLRVSALALAGAAMIGGVFALKGGVPGTLKRPPFIAAAGGPTKVQPPSDETVAASIDAGAAMVKGGAQPAQVKVIDSEEQPVDLAAQASLAKAATPAEGEPEAATAQHAPTAASGGTPVAATVNPPVVAAAAPAPPPIPLQFPDPKPVRTVSLRPDGTPVTTPSPAVADPGAPATEAPTPPAKPAPNTTSEAAGVAQPSTPKLELPAKPSGKSSARVMVAKTDTTGTGSAAETPRQPLQLGSPVKPEKAAKPPKSAVAAAEPPAPKQPPVDTAAAASSAGWAVQLAAPKSEGEAKSDLARLNAKYASSLNGATIGVHKAVVNGETVYRLRVVGLTKADAAALCARLKGDGGDCFIAK